MVWLGNGRYRDPYLLEPIFAIFCAVNSWASVGPLLPKASLTDYIATREFLIAGQRDKTISQQIANVASTIFSYLGKYLPQQKFL